MRIALLDLSSLEAFADHLHRFSCEWEDSDEPLSNPYSRTHRIDPAKVSERLRRRWALPLTEPEWMRAFAAVDGDHIVGHLDFKGGQLVSELHRARLGMGVCREYRRRGLGRRLLEAALAWARERPELAWVDLGVFATNRVAISLYENAGFVRVGAIADRFRVDGEVIDDIQMTLPVGTPSPPREQQ